MKRDIPENVDLLAAEFVIGTLVGRARRSFERRIARDPFIARRVRAWEDRFVLLALRLVPVAPSPAVWEAIARRTAGGSRSGGWRAIAAALAAVAVLGFGWIVWQELRPREPQAMAVVATEGGAPLWRVALAADGDYLEVEAVGEVSYPSDRARELWALPGEAAPVSLGLMPASGRVRIALDERKRAALAI
ncbi:MAG TPA: anti-sigma factor, partial [Steroidobacteraceae bacterium]|nr:anti-sigma factor [Steroidobacteraceae bacterium]